VIVKVNDDDFSEGFPIVHGAPDFFEDDIALEYNHIGFAQLALNAWMVEIQNGRHEKQPRSMRKAFRMFVVLIVYSI
jgi:hypothetical protein